MTEPSGRRTADTINDDELDELYARAEKAETKAAAMAAAMESTATDALRHRGCHHKLMAQCMRAEKAEAANSRVRALADRLDLLANACFGTPVSSVDKATAATANLIREALADPKEPRP